MTRADVRQAFIDGYALGFNEHDSGNEAADRYMSEKFPEVASGLECLIGRNHHVFLWAGTGARFVPTDCFRCQCGARTWKERLD